MTVPFDEPNNRIFWACQGVFVEERNTEAGNNGNPTGAEFLTGVQAVGVSSDNPAISLMDVGRHQRKYINYQQQTIEINISRVLDRASDTFYKVLESEYIGYKESHILNANNFGSKGAKDDNQKTLRNYDITILYTPDKFEQINAGNASSTDSDKNNVISVSYLNCLITNISYSIGVDGVEESVTLTTKNIKYNDDYTTLSDYSLPEEWYTPDSFERKLVNGDGEVSYEQVSYDPERYSPQEGDILKRQHFDLTQAGYGSSELPEEIKQLFNFDTPEILRERDEDLQILGIQSINIDASFDYTNLMDVGNWRGSEDTKEHEQNRWQVLNLPITVNCSFTGTLRQALPYYKYLNNGGENRVRNVDNVYSKSEAQGASTEWQETDREIKIVASGAGKHFVWDLGKKNYLTSIEYTGGDAGGGNVEATLSYTNQYSDFVITKTEEVLDLTNDGPY